MVGLSGLGPLTLRLSGVRSNQLSYRPIYVFFKRTFGSLKTEQYNSLPMSDLQSLYFYKAVSLERR